MGDLLNKQTIGWLLCILVPAFVIIMLQGLSRNYSKPNYILPIQMADGPAYRAYEQNSILPDRMTMQLPVQHTIARGYKIFHYDTTEASRVLAGNELKNPFTLDVQYLTRGKEVYKTFCLVCHGETGNGDGPIIPKYPNPTSFHTTQSKNLSDGALFHIVTYGRRNMPSYASQVDQTDRWKAILYIRQLQKKEW